VSYQPNQGDGWSYALSSVDRFFETVLERGDNKPVSTPSSILGGGLQSVPDELMEVTDSLFLEMMELLGRRTGELHLALAANRDAKEMAPEPFSKLYQRSAYQSIRSLVRRTMSTVRSVSRGLSEELTAAAEEFLSFESAMLGLASRITDHKIDVERIRIHGDYHLGQVLFTGRDFTIIDLEGEPARALSERRLKFSAFRDVAGMVRSFHYAISSRYLERTELRPEDREVLEPWIAPWYAYVAQTFLGGYLDTVDSAGFVPAAPDDTALLLDLFLMEKAVYEIGYEINNRPNWLMIPLRGIKFVLEHLEEET
jgi:maltose alpha-D-glucosyltransferase/alpha-amylase